ncbi:hypothetical protein [Paraburkholderia phenoliruptrix]|nr:hypothetical protein [Paraburkholderia phenoliruptrix]
MAILEMRTFLATQPTETVDCCCLEKGLFNPLQLNACAETSEFIE